MQKIYANNIEKEVLRNEATLNLHKELVQHLHCQSLLN